MELLSDNIKQQLASLESIIDSAYQSDIKAWDRRKKAELISAGQQGKGGKRGAKRQRLAALPELSMECVLSLRELEKLAIRDPAQNTPGLIKWAISVLAKLSRLDAETRHTIQDLDGFGVVKGLVLFGIRLTEVAFAVDGIEDAEMGLIGTTFDFFKSHDQRLWLLRRYCQHHPTTFLYSFHLYLINTLVSTRGVPKSLWLFTKAVIVLNPAENVRALRRLVDQYDSAVAELSTPGGNIPPNDVRRYIMQYLIELFNWHDDTVAESARVDPSLGFPPDSVRRWVQLEVAHRFSLNTRSRTDADEDAADTRGNILDSLDGIISQGINQKWLDRGIHRLTRLTSHYIDLRRCISEASEGSPGFPPGCVPEFEAACLNALMALNNKLQLLLLNSKLGADISAGSSLHDHIPEMVPAQLQTLLKATENIGAPGLAESRGVIERICALYAKMRSATAEYAVQLRGTRFSPVVSGLVVSLVEMIALRARPSSLSLLTATLLHSWPWRREDRYIVDREAAAVFSQALMTIDRSADHALSENLDLVFAECRSLASKPLEKVANMVHSLQAIVLAWEGGHRATAGGDSTSGAVLHWLVRSIARDWRHFWGFFFGVNREVENSKSNKKEQTLLACRVTLANMLTTMASSAGSFLTYQDCVVLCRDCVEILLEDTASNLYTQCVELLEACCKLLTNLGLHSDYREFVVESIFEALAGPCDTDVEVSLDDTHSDIDELSTSFRGLSTQHGQGVSNPMPSMLKQNMERPAFRYIRTSGSHSSNYYAQVRSFKQRPESPKVVQHPWLAQVLFRIQTELGEGNAGQLAVLINKFVRRRFPGAIPDLSPREIEKSVIEAGMASLDVKPEFFDVCRKNATLLHLALQLVLEETPTADRSASTGILDAIVLPLCAFWHKQLQSSVRNHPDHLKFTIQVIEFLVKVRPSTALVDGFSVVVPLLTSRDLASVIFNYIWRQSLHGLCADSKGSSQVLYHILRKSVAKTGPLFPLFFGTGDDAGGDSTQTGGGVASPRMQLDRDRLHV